MKNPSKINGALDVAAFSQLASCVDAIGTSSFASRICKYCALISSAEKVFLSAFFDNQSPVQLYSNHTEEADKETLKLYLDIAFVLDPFFIRFREKREDEVVTLNQVAPQDFRNSEYFHQFYCKIGLADECGLMLHLEKDAALFLSLGTTDEGGEIDTTNLQTALPLIAALVRRHWTVLSPEQPDGSGRLAAHLEAAFNSFGKSILSPRESEIVQLILKGHSSKAIARIFNNSPETIKVHRKRIFTKLGVASQGEILSLFISALSKMPATANGDPLQFLKGFESNQVSK